MRRSAEDIAHLYWQRRENAGGERQRMRDIAALYGGDIAIPLSELQREERSAVVNFARMGINQMGMRAASTPPRVVPVEVDYGRADSARKRAELRRRVNHGWWGANRLNLQMRQRARWLFAYATSPAYIKPCFKTDMPKWHPRSPLDTYSAPTTSMVDYVPTDCIFAQTRSVGWVRVHHPEHAMHFVNSHVDDFVDVVEYVDHEQVSIVLCLGARKRWEAQEGVMSPGGSGWNDTSRVGRGVMLTSFANRAGRPLAVVAGNVSLERRVGQYDGIIGMYQAQAKLQALSTIARERGVFQETWLVQRPGENEPPEVIAQADPRTGRVGIVRNGVFDRASVDPQYATDNGIALLERAQRVEAGIPADFGGEAGSNVRTGKRADGIISAAVDPLIQEAHDIFAASLEDENKAAIAIDKAYWGTESKSFYVSWGGDDCKVVYTPNDVWEIDEHRVRYPLPGGDVHDVNIATGQAIGAGMMSVRTGAGINPMIENPEFEHDQIIAEQLERAMLDQILAMATTPGAGMEPVDLARLAQLVKSDKVELFEAVQMVQREAQERQAAVPEAPAEAMPGLSPPGAGAEASGVFNTTPDQQGLSQLLMSLTGPQMALNTANSAGGGV